MLGALVRGKAGVTLADAAPVARLTAEYFAIAVPAESPIATAADLGAAMRADPAKVTWAGGQVGSVDHILAALFTRAIGGDPSRIAYAPFFGAGEMINAALEGQVGVVIASPRQLEEPVKAGKLRVIGVTAPRRLDGLDAPTLKEQQIELELANWRAVLGPAGSARRSARRCRAPSRTMVKSPAWDDIIRQKGWRDAYLPADLFAAFLAAEQARVADALRSVGLANRRRAARAQPARPGSLQLEAPLLHFGTDAHHHVLGGSCSICISRPSRRARRAGSRRISCPTAT